VTRSCNKSIFFASFVYLLFIFSCTPQAQKSLLTNGSTCINDGTCVENTATDIQGEPSILEDFAETTMNVEKSDLIEVTGTCNDLGRRDNRILVKVYSTEDESTAPYIDNSVSTNCQSNTLGLLTTQQCFFVTTGNGLSDASTGTSTVYPQCINGHYGFKVRLGSVSRVATILQKYIVRMQLITLTPSGQSALVKTAINRDLTAPTFSMKMDRDLNTCTVKIEADKFKTATSALENVPIVTYAIKRQDVGYDTNGAQNPAVIPVTPPDRLSGFFPFDISRIDAGDSIANFVDGSIFAYSVLNPTVPLALQPGVKYIYSIQAQAGADLSPISATKTCEVPTPTIGTIVSGSGTCTYTLVTGISSYFPYEWKYGTSAAQALGPGGITYGGCTSAPTCAFTKPGAGTYYVAVRTASGGMYSKFSNVATCN
jgi:hypothetical protein